LSNRPTRCDESKKITTVANHGYRTSTTASATPTASASGTTYRHDSRSGSSSANRARSVHPNAQSTNRHIAALPSHRPIN
jgi:hypothetical protein